MLLCYTVGSLQVGCCKWMVIHFRVLPTSKFDLLKN